MNGARGFPAHRFALRTLSNNRVSCSSLSSRAEPSGQCFSVEAYPLSCLRLTQRFCNDARLHFARSCGFRTTALRCRRSDCSWHTVHVGSPYRRPRDLDGFPTLATMSCLTLHVMTCMSVAVVDSRRESPPSVIVVAGSGPVRDLVHVYRNPAFTGLVYNVWRTLRCAEGPEDRINTSKKSRRG